MKSRGFILVNALVLVAVLAAVSVVLLQRAEVSRARLSQSQNAVQLSLYLQSYEGYIRQVLSRDMRAAIADHRGEVWAKIGTETALDRGQITGPVHDLQGRLNINGLVDGENTIARDHLGRLLAALSIPQSVGETLIAVLQDNATTGGIIDTFELAETGRFSDAHLERLSDHITALPTEAPLNVNTATLPVLTALIPDADPAKLGRLIQERQTEPFETVEDFSSRGGAILGSEAMAGIEIERLGVQSHWFAATISAKLGDQTRSRYVKIQRDPRAGAVWIALRINQSE